MDVSSDAAKLFYTFWEESSGRIRGVVDEIISAIGIIRIFSTLFSNFFNKLVEVWFVHVGFVM